jgi:hypothetical protein
MTNEPTSAPPVPSEAEGSESKGTSRQTEDKTCLISLAEAAEMYGFSHAYLRELARKGRLKAQKVGRDWVTTPADVGVYIASRQRRGVYRDDIGT